MMAPVFRTLFDRAAARRLSLLDLVAAIPRDFWSRTSPHEQWSALQHFAHALSTDALIEVLVKDLVSATESLDWSTYESRLLVSRNLAIAEADVALLDSLIRDGEAARASLGRTLAELQPAHLERQIVNRAVANAWGETQSITLFQYLEQWAAHDAQHEAAIRAAIATRPDLSVVAHSRRLS